MSDIKPDKGRPRCDGCRFWVKYDSEPSGQCRRFPPTVISSMHAHFPDTKAGFWCGEFQPKEITQSLEEIPVKGSSKKRS